MNCPTCNCPSELPSLSFKWLDRRLEASAAYTCPECLSLYVGWRALNRQIFPHGFRHTAATEDAKKGWGNEELKLRYGWSSNEMAEVYVHLTAQDVDEKDLRPHGFPELSHDGIIRQSQLRACFNCNAEIRATAKYCENCGARQPWPLAELQSASSGL